MTRLGASGAGALSVSRLAVSAVDSGDGAPGKGEGAPGKGEGRAPDAELAVAHPAAATAAASRTAAASGGHRTIIGLPIVGRRASLHQARAASIAPREVGFRN